MNLITVQLSSIVLAKPQLAYSSVPNKTSESSIPETFGYLMARGRRSGMKRNGTVAWVLLQHHLLALLVAYYSY